MNMDKGSVFLLLSIYKMFEISESLWDPYIFLLLPKTSLYLLNLFRIDITKQNQAYENPETYHNFPLRDAAFQL